MGKTKPVVIILHESVRQSMIADLNTIAVWTIAAALAKWSGLSMLYIVAIIICSFIMLIVVALNRSQRHRYTIEEARNVIDKIEEKWMTGR
jgi:membrane protein YdbS with pleckstrin-like domain